MQELLSRAVAHKSEIIAHRRRIHAFAECGFDLPKTLNYVNGILQKIGYAPHLYGKAGLVCELAPSTVAPTLLLRADMDALPLPERTNLPFRAENGCMHACGHDAHTAMLLGAAQLLWERRNTLSVRVRFLFQAAEELLLGASDAIRSGASDGVCGALMMHVGTALPYPSGTLLLPTEGEGAPAARFFTVTVKGESAHAGEPSAGVDALKAAIGLAERIYAMARKEGVALVLGALHGGAAHNVIADRALLRGTMRSFSLDAIARLSNGMEGACRAAAAEASVLWEGECPILQNDRRMIDLAKRAALRLGIDTHSLPPARSGASEDFAFFAERMPAVALCLSCGQRGRGYEHPLHHGQMLLDEEALPIGAALYAAAALCAAPADFSNFYQKPSLHN